MLKTLRTCAVALILPMILVIVPAAAQFPPAPDDQTPPASQKGKAAAPAGPDITGNWSGELTQVGSQSPQKFELAVSDKNAETKYPDLDCVGKLTHVGSSKSYAFFVEIITKGQVEKGGPCPDGTITIARQGDGLAVGWFGSVQGHTIVTYGTLKKKK
jgi:hypothetical protein